MNVTTRGYSAGGYYGIGVASYIDEEQQGPFYRKIPTNDEQFMEAEREPRGDFHVHRTDLGGKNISLSLKNGTRN